MFKHIFICLLGMIAISGSAIAQETCETSYEMIMSLKDPSLGVPVVWDARYDEREKLIQFYSGVHREDGTILSVGRVLNQDSYDPENLIFIALNRRNRVFLEKRHPIQKGEIPVKLMEYDGGYLMLSNMTGGSRNQDKYGRLAWYAKDASFRRDKILSDSQYNYVTKDIKPALNGNGFIVAMHAVHKTKANDRHGVIMRFNKAGQLAWKRAYRPGIPNGVDYIAKSDDQSYIVAGQIEVEDGRMGGWVMKLSYDGAILWQRTYPRGAMSWLTHAVTVGEGNQADKDYIFLGQSSPLDDGPDAMWVLSLDATGEVNWQRYIRRDDMALEPIALRYHDDGRITTVLNAVASVKAAQRDHIRLLTITPRGIIMNDEAFIEGLRAKANDVTVGNNGERLVIGTIESDEKPLDLSIMGDDFFAAPDLSDKDEEDNIKPKQVGWVFLAAALNEYKDPCVDESLFP